MADIERETATKSAPDDASAKLAADAHAAPEKSKTTDPVIANPDWTKDLKGGFNRNEKPELRKSYPPVDYKSSLVPKDSPTATSGEAPRSVSDTIKKEISGTIGDLLGKAVDIAAKLGHKSAGDDWNKFGQDRSLPGQLKDLARPADLRHQMEQYNLKSSYPPGENTAGVPQILVPPASAEVERTANGIGNDLKDPAQGAQGTRFQYNTTPDTRYAIDDPPITDTARILARTEGFKALPVLNELGAFNLQANVHDWMDHGKHQNMDPSSFWHIPLPADHPIAQPTSLPAKDAGSYTLTTGDKLDVAKGEQALTTPDGSKVVVKQDGAFEVNGKAVKAIDDGKTVKLADGTVVREDDKNNIAAVERNGQEAKIPGQKEMLIPKLLIDGSRTPADDKAGIRTTYIDNVTQWWDASEIYGSDQATNDRLRTHQDGKMKLDTSVDKNGLLPMGPEGVPDTGFNQNWNPGLEVVHTLYVREHNNVCDMLTKAYPKDKYPEWKDKLSEIIKPLFGNPPPAKLSDEQYDHFIYGRARLITSAEIAKIHTVDWTPVALNNKTMTKGMNTNYGQEKIEPLSKIFNQDELGGIWGNKIHKAGVPYAMEEDFVQSYQQMHGLVPDDLKLFDYKTNKQIADVPMDHALQGDAHTVIQKAGFDNVLYSMQKNLAGQIAAHNDPDFMRDLDIRGNKIDLTAVDILRGREKHLPRYNEYLRQMHMPPVKSFEELIPDNPALSKEQRAENDKLREEVRKVYSDAKHPNGDIEKVDTVIGSLSEWPGRTPATMGFSGSTFLEFILMASRRVQSDRFYTTDFRPEIYTPEGIDRIRGLNGMNDIISRNAPDLKPLETRESAFHPLGTGPIPLNSSGIDEVAANDIQGHIAAFSPENKGEVSLPQLEKGFEDLGYSSTALNPLNNAWFKAAMAAYKFGGKMAAVGLAPVEIAKVKPEDGGMYKTDGNIDQAKVDALFHGKDSINHADVDSYMNDRHLSFLPKHFVEGQFESAFKTVGKDSITRDEFEKIMNGDLIKQKIDAVEKAKAEANAKLKK